MFTPPSFVYINSTNTLMSTFVIIKQLLIQNLTTIINVIFPKKIEHLNITYNKIEKKECVELMKMDLNYKGVKTNNRLLNVAKSYSQAVTNFLLQE